MCGDIVIMDYIAKRLGYHYLYYVLGDLIPAHIYLNRTIWNTMVSKSSFVTLVGKKSL